MKSTIVYYFVKLFLKATSLLSLSANHSIGSFIGLCLYGFNTKARQISEINILTCFPELSPQEQNLLVKNSLQELGKTITELGAVWLWNPEKLFKHLIVEGQDMVEKAIAEERGVILITPHLGCWEMAGLYTAFHWENLILYQPPKIKSLESIIITARARFGGKVVATDKRGIASLIKSLRSGKTTGILPDQTPKEKSSGTFAPFFGRPALTINLVSSLARKSQAKVFMCIAKRLPKGQGYVLSFQEPCAGIDDKDSLLSATALNQSVEQLINQAPEQYLWSYKRFKQVPEGVEEIY